MNKDLDDRIMPNGEYRDALDIIISESENGNVGTVQSILGNKIVKTNRGVTTTIIGSYFDSTNNRIFLFETDHESESVAPRTATCKIVMFDVLSGTTNTLVDGSFLNFSTRKYIYAINILENLLFWVDDRNQPRKINIDTAINEENYYTQEEHVSVAKYSPYQPITLIRSAVEAITQVTPDIEVDLNYEILPGATVLSTDNAGLDKITADDYIKVATVSHDTVNNKTTITLDPTPAASIAVTDIFYFFSSTMVDGTDNGNTNYPGDPEFLKSKFVRFSYRFQFDDNEYSLIAPFTQIAFVPNQKGYFFGDDDDGVKDQQKAYESTIVRFMENFANKITLMIPLPCKASNLQNNFKVKNLEVLYKESDQISIKVLDEISINQIELNSGENTFYSYEYQSRKPIKTLPQSETTRVFDQVPVKAQSQEIISNRVVYANYQNKHTAPASINYNVLVEEKNKTPQFTNYIEYPFHSLKQNRNYQVGFVLSDKYGRSSGVILSTVDDGVEEAGIFYKGSTIYSPYFDSDGDFVSDVRDWRGNTFAVRVNDQITSVKNNTGSPGLYAEAIGNGFELDSAYTATISGNTYTFRNDDTNGLTDIPTVGSYLRGAHTDYVGVTNVDAIIAPVYTITTDGEVSSRLLNSDNSPDTKFSYNINPLGWYSYKVVVKQTEQDYYNVYLPGIISGYPETNLPLQTGIDSDVELTSTAHVILLSDNINKIPRDLSEVGPDQIQYRSSVRLYGRVENQWDSSGAGTTYNTQYYPGAFSHEVTQIMTTSESGFVALRPEALLVADQYTINPFLLYNFSTNPLIAKISTNRQIGVERDQGPTEELYPAVDLDPPIEADSAEPFLAVYETDAFESALDIFYESSTSGLISDINEDVLVEYDGPVAWEDAILEFDESKTAPNTPPPALGPDGGQEITSDWFYPVDQFNVEIPNSSATMTVETSSGRNATNDFNLYQETTGVNAGKYKIYVKPRSDSGNPFIYDFESSIDDEITFNIVVNGVLLPLTTPLLNVQPTMTQSDGTAFKNDSFDPDYTMTGLTSTIDTLSGDNEGTGSPSKGVRYILQNQGSIPATSGGADNLQLNVTSGELSIADQTTIPNGVYNPTIRVIDATSSTGATDGTANGNTYSIPTVNLPPEQNSLYRDYIVYIKKGYAPFGDALESDYYGYTHTYDGSTWRGTQQLTPNDIDGYVGFYLSTTTINPSDFPDPRLDTFTEPTAWNVNDGEYGTLNPLPILDGGSFPTAFAQGSEFQIKTTLETYLEASCTSAPCSCGSNPANARYRLHKVWHRPNSSSSWAEVQDYTGTGDNTGNENNFAMKCVGGNRTFFGGNENDPQIFYSQVGPDETVTYEHWMGLKIPNGSSDQYLFTYQYGLTGASSCDANMNISFLGYCEVKDLRFGQGAAGVDYVEVTFYDDSYDATTPSCVTGSTTQTLYTDTAIGKAVTQLYTDTGLTEPFDPVADSNGEGWYAVRVAGNPGQYGTGTTPPDAVFNFMYVNSDGSVDTFTNQTGLCTSPYTSNDYEYAYPQSITLT